ncbi:MAG: glucose-6-phosphate dehydrogenase, partial [Polaromonas sp.]
MTTHLPAAGALDIVIFGGTGDLSFRKLLPALYMAHLHEKLAADARIIAIGRQDWTHDEYLAFIDSHSPAFIDASAFSASDWQHFLARLTYVSMDVMQGKDYARLKTLCSQPALRVFYLATAPSLFTQICARLSDAGLVDAQARVVLEKPLGTDLASARAINTEVARYFDEHQIYRIDHYLGKETVQNHLLQLLCIVAMEPPISLDADDVRDEKLKVLRSLRKMDLAGIKRDTVRGQYTAGASDGAAVKGYLEEDDVPAGSRTETFVALRAHIDNTRWANVPFFLRTGKRMPQRQSQIIIEFADQPFSIFGTAPTTEASRQKE